MLFFGPLLKAIFFGVYILRMQCSLVPSTVKKEDRRDTINMFQKKAVNILEGFSKIIKRKQCGKQRRIRIIAKQARKMRTSVQLLREEAELQKFNFTIIIHFCFIQILQKKKSQKILQIKKSGFQVESLYNFFYFSWENGEFEQFKEQFQMSGLPPALQSHIASCFRTVVASIPHTNFSDEATNAVNYAPRFITKQPSLCGTGNAVLTKERLLQRIEDRCIDAHVQKLKANTIQTMHHTVVSNKHHDSHFDSRSSFDGSKQSLPQVLLQSSVGMRVEYILEMVAGGSFIQSKASNKKSIKIITLLPKHRGKRGHM